MQFGPGESERQRRLGASKKTAKKPPKRANLLIMVSSRLQRSIQVEWPAKAQETEFGAIRSMGTHRTAEKPTKNRQNRANLLIMVSSRFQHSIPVEWPAKAQETKFGAIRSRGKRRAVSSWSQPKKTPKNRQNRANLLIMVSSRVQRLIQVEWPAKAQEIEFGAIRSRGKRRTASSWSRPKKTPKVAPGSKIGVIC